MKYVKTNWLDKIVEFPNRYKDQNENILILTEEPGDIAQEGTLVDSPKLNKIEQGIYDLSESKNFNNLLYDTENTSANNFYLEAEISELSIGDIFYVKIPFSEITEDTNCDIKISVDNNTYYNLKELDGDINLKSSGFNYKDRYLSIFFDGTDFRLTKNLPNEITAGLLGDYSYATTTSGALNMAKTNVVGDKLTVSENKIVIGSGVSKIEVSGSIMIQNTSDGTNYWWQPYIKHTPNGGTITNIATARQIVNAGTYGYLSMPALLVDVNEGDTLQLGWVKNGTSGIKLLKGSGTKLTVRVID